MARPGSQFADPKTLKPGTALSLCLSKEFPPPVGRILDHFEITLREGEIVCLLGTSGCGKTTILNMIAGLTSSEEITGAEGGERRLPHEVGFAFQRPELLPWRDAESNARHEAEVLGRDTGDIDELIGQLLRLTTLESYRKLYPDELSVGMQQRLQLVRVLACPRPVMLLDEPLGAVDQPSRLRIAGAARDRLKASGSACLWVTHDSLEATTVADSVVVLGGRPLRAIAQHTVFRSADNAAREERSRSTTKDLSIDGQAADLRRVLSDVVFDGNNRVGKISATVSPRPRTWQRPKWSAMPILALALFLGSWQALVALHPALRFYLSTPSEWIPVLASGLFSGELLGHLMVTLSEAGLGLVIAGPTGIVAGFTTAHSVRLSSALRPVLAGMTAVPLFVLAPAFILWFGIGSAMKVAIAALSAFPFIAYMTHDGAIEARGIYYRYLRSQADAGRLFTSLVLPSTIEGIIESLRPAAVAALIGAFLGEFIAANEGLGYFIILQGSRYNVAEVFAGVSLLFAVAILIDWLCRYAGTARHRLVASTIKIFS